MVNLNCCRVRIANTRKKRIPKGSGISIFSLSDCMFILTQDVPKLDVFLFLIYCNSRILWAHEDISLTWVEIGGTPFPIFSVSSLCSISVLVEYLRRSLSILVKFLAIKVSLFLFYNYSYLFYSSLINNSYIKVAELQIQYVCNFHTPNI